MLLSVGREPWSRYPAFDCESASAALGVSDARLAAETRPATSGTRESLDRALYWATDWRPDRGPGLRRAAGPELQARATSLFGSLTATPELRRSRVNDGLPTCGSRASSGFSGRQRLAITRRDWPTFARKLCAAESGWNPRTCSAVRVIPSASPEDPGRLVRTQDLVSPDPESTDPGSPIADRDVARSLRRIV